MKLLKIEWLKLKGHRFFWIGFGLYIVCMVLLISKFGSASVMDKDADTPGQGVMRNFGEAGFYKLPYLWQNITYLAGFFKFIPTFLLIFFVANEFQYKTLRQNIIDGLSIREFYFSKLISSVMFSLISLLVIVISGFFIALSYNPEATAADYLSHTDYLLAYFAEVLFLIVMALFLTLLFKRSTISIIVILLYYFIVEPIAGFALGSPVKEYLPTRPSRELILQPFSRMFQVDSFFGIESPDRVNYRFLALTFLYTVIFAVGGYYILKKRDL